MKIMYNPLKIFRLDHLFFGCFAGFILILTLLITWISYTVSSQELLKTTSFYQQGLLSELNKKLDLQLNTIEQISLSTSRNIDFLDYFSFNGDEYTRNKKFNDNLQYLTNIANSVSSIYSINVYIDHPISTDWQRPVQFYDYSRLKAESWYPIVQNSDFAWIGEHTIRTFQGPFPVVSFARKIYSNKNEYLGLIVLNIKASIVRDLMQGESNSVNRMLFDSGGHLLVKVGNPAKENVFSYLESMEYGVGSRRIPASGGQESDLLAWSKIYNSEWILTELTPWGRVTNGSLRLAYILLTIGFFTFLIALCVSFSISRQLLKPVRILVQAMGKYAFDRTKVYLPNDYRNEFGYLFNGYRRQMERIDELYKSIEIHHRRQREAEVKALQANINPHFLYNTLDQINWMALQEGQQKISDILELTGQMFRIGLSNGESLIPIGDELQHVECYMRIQQIRWEEGLSYEIRVPEPLKTNLIPKITLQPFVENAILHGFHGRCSGTIIIQAILAHNKIVFTLSDNGKGFNVNQQQNRKIIKGGYGIRNVRERIDALFGPAYGIKMESNADCGTVVTISLPLLEPGSDKERGGSFVS
jgi:two-component system sensor histidine kinase YesM